MTTAAINLGDRVRVLHGEHAGAIGKVFGEAREGKAIVELHGYRASAVQNEAPSPNEPIAATDGVESGPLSPKQDRSPMVGWEWVKE